MASRKPIILFVVVILFIVYYLQDILYSGGSLISQLAILLFLLIGLFYYGKTAIYVHKPFFVTMWLIFYFVQAITFLFSPKEVFGTVYEAIGRASTLEQFKGISVFMLSFCVGYVISRKYGKLNENLFVYIGLAFFALAFVRYFYMLNTLLSTLKVDAVTNNSGYFIVGAFPFLPFLLKRNKIFGFVLLILSILLIMFAAKRGTIVCMLAALFFSLMFYMKMNKASVKTFFITLILLLGVSYLIYYAYESNEWLLARMEFMEDNGIGGRGLAYPILFGHWYNDTNFWTLMFGNGMAQSVTVWGNFAHNDWLELLISNGAVGVILYLTIFISMIKFLRNSSLSPIMRLSAYLCILIWFLQSIFSMGYTAISNAEYILLLGLIAGKEKVRIKTEKHNG